MLGKSAMFATVLGAGVLVAGGGALAFHPGMNAPKTPGGQAAAARHQNFGKLGATVKALNEELKKDSPDKAAVKANATTIATLANQLPTWFPKGSGREAWSDVEAKADVWSDAAGFKAAADNFKVQAGKLQQVANSGDLDAVKAQVRATGGACKACHDKYREEKKG